MNACKRASCARAVHRDYLTCSREGIKLVQRYNEDGEELAKW